MIKLIFLLFFTFLATTYASEEKEPVNWKDPNFYFCEHVHQIKKATRLPDEETARKWQNDCENECNLVDAYFVGDPNKRVELLCFNRMLPAIMNTLNRKECECVYSGDVKPNPAGYQNCYPPKIIKDVPLEMCDFHCKVRDFMIYRSGDVPKVFKYLAACDKLWDLELPKARGVSRCWLPSQFKITCHCGLHFDERYLNLHLNKRLKYLSLPAKSQITKKLSKVGIIGSQRVNNTGQCSASRVIINSGISSLEKDAIYTRQNKNSTHHLSRNLSNFDGITTGQPSTAHNTIMQTSQSLPSSSIVHPAYGQSALKQKSTSHKNIQNMQSLSQSTEKISLELSISPIAGNHSHQIRQEVLNNGSSSSVLRSAQEPTSTFPYTENNTQLVHGLPRHDSIDLSLSLGPKLGSSRDPKVPSAPVQKNRRSSTHSVNTDLFLGTKVYKNIKETNFKK